jgi:hypothetical protein
MERLDGAVRGALRGVGVPDAGVLAEVTRVWPTAVGDAIGRAAWPKRIGGDGTLQVSTASSTWAFELGLLADEILAKLAAAVGTGAPTAIRFSAGPIPEASSPTDPSASATPAEADPQTRLLAAELTAAMSDDALRETIARAAAASLARAAADRHF